MKTVGELQQEVRSIQKDLLKMNERLSSIDYELANYKESFHENSIYQRIYNIAETMPIIKHPILTQNANVKSNYFRILLMIALVDDTINEEQLLFMQRMIMADDNRNQIDNYLGNLEKIQPENVLFKLEGTIKKENAEILILDMLIIANLGRNKTKKSFEIISNIAAFMGKGKNDNCRICPVAVTVLKQEIDGLSNGFRDILEIDIRYGHYLSKISLWKDKVTMATKELDEYNKKMASKRSDISAFHNQKDEYEDKWFYYTN